MNCRALFYSIALLIGFVPLGHAEAQVQIDQVPMYGGIDRNANPEFKAGDDKFIADTTSHFGTREKASTALWREGDGQLARGNLEYAMKRYNQSWILNPNNYQPYWGFGRVMAQREKPDEAIRYLEKSLQLIDDTYQKVALLTDIAMVYSQKAFYTPIGNNSERAQWFALANKNFEESTRMDPSYANSWRGWARSLFLEERFTDAWDKVKKAKSLNASFPPKFINSLEEKMPEC